MNFMKKINLEGIIKLFAPKADVYHIDGEQLLKLLKQKIKLSKAFSSIYSNIDSLELVNKSNKIRLVYDNKIEPFDLEFLLCMLFNGTLCSITCRGKDTNNLIIKII